MVSRFARYKLFHLILLDIHNEFFYFSVSYLFSFNPRNKIADKLIWDFNLFCNYLRNELIETCLDIILSFLINFSF